ncbi:MAG: hypothetical protein LBH60_06290 [Prevotellaceae bacterium]|jgi:hypothetical protein|nr:hypothetical protein [Prevotellaceae bacterium]
MKDNQKSMSNRAGQVSTLGAGNLAIGRSKSVKSDKKPDRYDEKPLQAVFFLELNGLRYSTAVFYKPGNDLNLHKLSGVSQETIGDLHKLSEVSQEMI